MSCTFFIVSADVLPQFWGDLSNVTVAIGREASFTCNIKNLGNYKVSEGGWVTTESDCIVILNQKGPKNISLYFLRFFKLILMIFQIGAGPDEGVVKILKSS